MARPRKYNADYFSHDADARHNLKIKALESQMGLIGYALYFKLLEFLAGSDHYEVDISKPYIKKSLPADLGCSKEEFETFLKLAIELDLLVEEQEKIYSPGLKKRLSVLDRIRELDRKRKGIEEYDPTNQKDSPDGKNQENSVNIPSKEKNKIEKGDRKEEEKIVYENMTIDDLKIELISLGLSRQDANDLFDQYSREKIIKELEFFQGNIMNKNKYTSEQKLHYLKNLNKYGKK